jgi:hypothetical protein
VVSLIFPPRVRSQIGLGLCGTRASYSVGHGHTGERGMMYEVEQFEHAGRKVTISVDPEPSSPRDWDNLGTMVTWHRRYELGDVRWTDYGAQIEGRQLTDPNVALRYLRLIHGAEIVMLGLIDHSGISMYVGGGPAVGDSQGWDSGTVGFIYVTRETIVREHGADTPESRENARACLVSEVETYDQYLRGDVYGYTVEDEAGNVLDSCWGFYGAEYAMDEARAAAEWMMDSWRDKWIAAAEYWRAKGEYQYARACQVHAEDADLFTEDEHRGMYGVGLAR